MAEQGYSIDDLELGMAAESARVVQEEDVVAFAAVTGDDNPVHLDQSFAERTPFRGRIAHGLLAAGYISALLGAKLPGPGAIYVSQTLSFKRPVKFGDEVVSRVEIVAIDRAASHVTLSCTSRVRGKLVMDGQAVVIPRRK